MRTAPALVLAVALAFGSGALGEQARAVTREVGERTEEIGQSERAGGVALMQSLRRALHGGAIADPDRDGMVSRDEAIRYLDARFARMDADLNGVLGEAEFVQGGLERAVRGLKAASLARPRNADFEAADLDGDGSLSPEEFLQAAPLRQAAEQRAPHERARAGVFRGLDADGDGVISRGDFMAAASARFTAIDPDGDDRISIWRFLTTLRF